jgi:hypothetical protein
VLLRAFPCISPSSKVLVGQSARHCGFVLGMATFLVSAMSLGGPGLHPNLPENGLVLSQTIGSESATVVLLQSPMVWNTVYGRRFINVSGPVVAPADSGLCNSPSPELAGHIVLGSDWTTPGCSMQALQSTPDPSPNPNPKQARSPQHWHLDSTELESESEPQPLTRLVPACCKTLAC